MTMMQILNGVYAERLRQDQKWGDITKHLGREDGTGGVMYEAIARSFRRDCDEAKRLQGDATWAQIIQEEVYEALAETDPEKIEAELVQVAAVCVAWIEAIRRRRA